MKNNINIVLSIAAAILVFASCSKTENLSADTLATSAQAGVSVHGVLSETKASVSSYKSNWKQNDWIRVCNNGSFTFFKANDEAESSSFTVSASNNIKLAGEAVALYPKNVALESGKGSFSLAGQNGSFEGVENFFLMTSSASVRDGKLTFNFQSHMAVLAINAASFMYDNSSISNIVISGKGVSSNISIDASNGNVKVAAADASEIVLDKPFISADGYVFVALLPTAGEISVEVNDNAEGHFFTTIDGSSLEAGFINEIESSWDGGRAITFNPSVADWA